MLSKRLEKLCKDNGLPRITIHELRHTFITRCHERGVEELTTQSWCGQPKHIESETHQIIVCRGLLGLVKHGRVTATSKMWALNNRKPKIPSWHTGRWTPKFKDINRYSIFKQKHVNSYKIEITYRGKKYAIHGKTVDHVRGRLQERIDQWLKLEKQLHPD